MCPCGKQYQWHPRLHQSIVNMWREVFFSLYLALLRHMWVLQTVLGSPAKERHGHAGVSSVKAIKMMKGLKHLSYEERL